MKVNFKDNLYNKRYLFAAVFIIAVGVFVRVFRFGSLPDGFNQDEAFAAYEAFSLMNYGVDSAGYHNPTYFVAWGSGMNVLESYLAIPFMWIFGCNETVFRLPQLLCGIATMPVLYLLLNRLFDLKTAFIGLSVLAVSPWHIMLSRWGLESNLAPAFLLFGFFFLVKGIEKNGYFLLSALFYGISLYAYSITWLAVPLMLVGFFIYFLLSKTKIKPFTVIAACLILFVLALPHILFLAVNNGIIPEIKTSFISIPKMVSMRSGEIAVSNLWSLESWKGLVSILLYQNDGLIWNCIDGFGLFYLFNIVFVAIGLGKLVVNLKNDVKIKRFSGSAFVLIGFICTVFVCLLINGININKSNCLHLFTLIISAVGVKSIIEFNLLRFIKPSFICLYAISFALFCSCYFGEYNSYISLEFRNGVGEAVKFVNSQNFDEVAVDDSIYHSQIMFYDKTSHNEFKKTIKYKNYPSPYLAAESFGKYHFGFDYHSPGDYDAYIIDYSRIDYFSTAEYELRKFGSYAVVIPKKR